MRNFIDESSLYTILHRERETRKSVPDMQLKCNLQIE